MRKVQSLSYQQGTFWSHQPLSLCRIFFGVCSVRLGTSRTDLTAPVTHQDQGLQPYLFVFSLCGPCPLLRTQKIFGSRPCPNRVCQNSWLLANPSWLTAWAVKSVRLATETLMSLSRGGTVDQSGNMVFDQPQSVVPRPNPNPHLNNFSGRKGT
jgi:hypothetical protein